MLQVTKDWRVVDVSKHCQDTVDLESVQNQYVSKPHPLEFDEKRHKSLNAELKYLYTAITRAKCNLWIYDENQEKRNPMFYYWMVSGLARIVKLGASDEDNQNLFKAKPSTPDEWEEQGNKYKAHQLWKEAATSYRNANIPHLEKEAEAYMFAQQAGETETGKDQLYIRAAECFLTSDKHEHNVELLKEASRCFRNAKKYDEAVSLFKRLGMLDEAVHCLQYSGQITEAGSLCESIGKVNNIDILYFGNTMSFGFILSLILKIKCMYSKRVRVLLFTKYCDSVYNWPFCLIYNRSMKPGNSTSKPKHTLSCHIYLSRKKILMKLLQCGLGQESSLKR